MIKKRQSLLLLRPRWDFSFAQTGVGDKSDLEPDFDTFTNG